MQISMVFRAPVETYLSEFGNNCPQITHIYRAKDARSSVYTMCK